MPQLVRNVRSALDGLDRSADLPAGSSREARRYFRDIKIVVSGGFDPRRIARFRRENVPADVFGLGSFLMNGPSNDFTADVVRVKVDGQWRDMAKRGRKARSNPELEPVS